MLLPTLNFRSCISVNLSKSPEEKTGIIGVRTRIKSFRLYKPDKDPMGVTQCVWGRDLSLNMNIDRTMTGRLNRI